MRVPRAIAPIDHYANLSRTSGSDWRGDCPFCDKERHLYANPETGQWDCKVCGESGNVVSFLTAMTKVAAREMTSELVRDLRRDRGIPTKYLRRAGVGYWPATDEYLIPCFSPRGTVVDVRRHDGKRTMTTPGCNLQLWNARGLAEAAPDVPVYLCEGEWDAIACQWLLDSAGASGVVVAAPGASIFKNDWCEGFRGRRVIVVYDRDPAGDRGQVKVADRLRGVAREIEFVHWPSDAAEGFDLRDFMVERADADPVERLRELESLLRKRPTVDVGDGDVRPSEGSRYAERDLRDGVTFADVRAAFERRIEMSDDLRDVLRLVAATCLAAEMRGDPLWFYVVGPASSGKTLVLGAFRESERTVFASSFTRNTLISGYKDPTGKDPSLLPRLKGKTFVVKDFTEILSKDQMEKAEIFSTLRGAYDGFTGKQYGHLNREYKDCFFTMIAATTDDIHAISNVSYGERFLKFELSDVDDETTNRRQDNAIESIGDEGSAEDELTLVVASWLKRDLPRAKADLPTLEGEERERVKRVARLVARLRTEAKRNFSGDLTHRARAESPIRLTKQLSKLAMMLAVLDDQRRVGESHVRLVERVGFDTVYGFTRDAVDCMMTHLNGYATKKQIKDLADVPYATIDDLIAIGVIAPTGNRVSPTGMGRPAVEYQVSPDVAALWRSVKGDPKCQTKSKRRRESPPSTPTSPPPSTKSSAGSGGSGVGRRGSTRGPASSNSSSGSTTRSARRSRGSSGRRRVYVRSPTRRSSSRRSEE